VAQLQVELVAADRKVWSGPASMVIAKTTEGDVGILPGHVPFLGVLVNGAVQVRRDGADPVVAAVHGGFLSLADDQVSILAEVAELASEIDVERARSALARIEAMPELDAEAKAAKERALARIRAAGLAF
jgi:F-type H+-transporting ATPase subunit epsilon